MIRINLIPVRAAKKRELGRQVLILFAVVLAGVGLANYFWYDMRASVRDRNKEQITKTKAKIAELERVIGEVNNITKRKKEVEEKLKVLDQLKKGRSGPVRMMDALSNAIPKKVWVRDFDEQGGGVKLQGTALTNDDVAEFMRGLSNIVWTPKGMGRLVEQRRDSTKSRVELISGGGSIEDFPVGDVANFFTDIELKNAVQKDVGNSGGPGGATTLVDFELGMKANYSI